MIKDERIQSARRHIQSQGFFIYLWLLTISLLYRQFYLKQPLEQYWDIAAIWLIGGLVTSFLIFSRGAVQYPATVKRFYKRVIPAGVIVIVTVNYIRGKITSINQLIEDIIGCLIGYAIAMLIIHILYKRWERKI